MINKLILRIKHSKLGYKTRTLIFGKQKTNSKDMKEIEKLETELHDLIKEKFFENDEIKSNDLQLKISKIESDINYIRKNQNKYILRIVTELGDRWFDPYYSTIDLEINNPINLSQPNLDQGLIELKLEIENYLVNKELVDLKLIKEIYIKRKK